MVTIKNISKDGRAVSYGVVSGPKFVEPGATVLIYEWALEGYVSQVYWEEVVGPVEDVKPKLPVLVTSKEA